MPTYVTSERYQVDIGDHVFPTEKYNLVRHRLRHDAGTLTADFVEPSAASFEDIQHVHTRRYFEACRYGLLAMDEILRLELPWSPALFEASRLSAGGTILAIELALEHGVGLHIGGGFHHAFPDHGEGFCLFNDVAIAIQTHRSRRSIERAVIIDTDLHHGNGTAAIFATHSDVATFSIHEEGIYPAEKPASDIDIGLPAHTSDVTYLASLESAALPLLDAHGPDLVVHVAGADPFREDQLGSLDLSKEGLRRRDQLLTDACEQRGLPLVIVLAGGYARNVEDTVDIHVTTLLESSALWR